MGVTVKGLDAICDFGKQIIDAIPDYSGIPDVALSPEGAVICELRGSGGGTIVKPLLGLPLGKNFRFSLVFLAELSADLKVSRLCTEFRPPPITPDLDAGKFKGLNSASLLCSMSMTDSGSRAAQMLMNFASGHSEQMAPQLRNHIWVLSGLPYGNYVVQTYIRVMPPKASVFIAMELLERAVTAAQHKLRSRILERLLERCPEEMLEPLVKVLLEHLEPLCRHPFGNFVIQRLVETASQDILHHCATDLLPGINDLARHRQGNNIVKRLLVHCSPADKRALADALIGGPGGLTGLARHSCGSFVARELRQLECIL